MDFDPVPYWERVTCPVLAFFGELDRTVPPEGSERILEDALRRAGNRNHRIIVLPKANHLFLRAETGVRTEYPQLKSFVTGYFDVMTNWLSRRVSTRR